MKRFKKGPEEQYCNFYLYQTQRSISQRNCKAPQIEVTKPYEQLQDYQSRFQIWTIFIFSITKELEMGCRVITKQALAVPVSASRGS